MDTNTLENSQEKVSWFQEDVKKSTMKTYRDSFLYNQSSSKGENLSKKHEQLLINFIMKADRIDKTSEAFKGIAEDVKRQQTTSILYSILMMDNVHLCINSVELPQVFKVIDAFDLRSTERKPAIFIDVTKLVTERNGYYVCKNIGKLISYLMAALIYLTYRKDTNKVISNSAIIINGLECYVNMFLYILDYLRIIGYTQNKDKIGYFAGLFFLHNMMDRELDNYNKNMAAKVAKISPANISAYDLYIDDNMFDNIDTFITSIADMFKLKGLTTEVFVQKWIFLFGNGTQYGCELFTSFAVIQAYTFCGTYIVNQKQIEKCCGNSMIKFCNAFMIIGTEMYDRRMYMSEAELAELEPKDKLAQELSESLKKSQEVVPDDLKFIKEDFCDKEKIEEKIKQNLDYYFGVVNAQDKFDCIFEDAMKKIVYSMEGTIEGSSDFYFAPGAAVSMSKAVAKNCSSQCKNRIRNGINNKIDIFVESMRECRDEDPDLAKMYSSFVRELRECVNIL